MRRPEIRAGQLKARGRLAVAGLIAATASTACYNYVPVSLGTVGPKEDVRVRVTDAAAVRLSETLGAVSNEIDGAIARQGSDSIAVGVSIARAYRGTTIGTTTQLLSLGRSEILDVRKRQFSRGRTVLLAAGTVGGFGLLAAGISALVDPNGPPDDQRPPPPPVTLRRPSGLRIRIPIP